MRPLTKRQREIFDFLREHMHSKGYAPSLGEIGRRFGLSSLATVSKHLTNLQEKGYITRRYGHSRAIELNLKAATGCCPLCGRTSEAHEIAAAEGRI